MCDCVEKIRKLRERLEEESEKLKLSANPDDWWKAYAKDVLAHGVEMAAQLLLSDEGEWLGSKEVHGYFTPKMKQARKELLEEMMEGDEPITKEEIENVRKEWKKEPREEMV